MNLAFNSKVASYLVAAALVLALAFGFSAPASADTCTGSCGTLGANGDVPLSPLGHPAYQWISTNGGVAGVGALAGVGGSGHPTDGSTLQTSNFAANAGDHLNFYFDYTTSDGAGFADYSWAELVNASDSSTALLFTARTTPGGNSVPGFSMPDPAATLNPATVTIQDGKTNWSPLGSWSGQCFEGPGQGCGSTGWVSSDYLVSTGGSYFLLFGVTNWNDTIYDSGMAIDGITIGGVPIEPPPTGAPEPATLLLLGAGIAPILLKRRR